MIGLVLQMFTGGATGETAATSPGSGAEFEAEVGSADAAEAVSPGPLQPAPQDDSPSSEGAAPAVDPVYSVLPQVPLPGIARGFDLSVLAQSVESVLPPVRVPSPEPQPASVGQETDVECLAQPVEARVPQPGETPSPPEEKVSPDQLTDRPGDLTDRPDEPVGDPEGVALKPDVSPVFAPAASDPPPTASSPEMQDDPVAEPEVPDLPASAAPAPPQVPEPSWKSIRRTAAEHDSASPLRLVAASMAAPQPNASPASLPPQKAPEHQTQGVQPPAPPSTGRSHPDDPRQHRIAEPAKRSAVIWAHADRTKVEDPAQAGEGFPPGLDLKVSIASRPAGGEDRILGATPPVAARELAPAGPYPGNSTSDEPLKAAAPRPASNPLAALQPVDDPNDALSGPTGTDPVRMGVQVAVEGRFLEQKPAVRRGNLVLPEGASLTTFRTQEVTAPTPTPAPVPVEFPQASDGSAPGLEPSQIGPGGERAVPAQPDASTAQPLPNADAMITPDAPAHAPEAGTEVGSGWTDRTTTATTPAQHRGAHPVPAGTAPDPTPPPAAEAAEAQDEGLKLVLRPEELGRVTMTMAQDGESLRVLVQAERAETLDLMRRNSDQLGAELKQAGFAGASLSFGGRDGQRPSRGQAPAGEGPAGPAPAAPAPATARTGLDLRI